MALVVFLRAANVGGTSVFKPSQLAKDLAPLDVKNIGAAGTFVVRGDVDALALREEMARRVPFELEAMVRPAREIVDLVERDPLADRVTEGVKPFVSVLDAPPSPAPMLPARAPSGDAWEVEVVRVEGAYALSLHRRGPKGLYPNEVVERSLGRRATTRGWPTLLTIRKAIGDDV